MESTNPATCTVHESAPATGQCVQCARAICEACTTHLAAGATCPECIGTASDRRRRISRAIVALAVVLAVGAAAFVVLGHEAAAEDTDPSTVRSDDTPKVIAQRRRWGERRCDRDATVDLGEALLDQNDAAGALALVEVYKAECEVERRVLWIALSAHKRLKQWAAALEVADVLVNERSSDSNYWWWRAEARAELGDVFGAAADYRQSFALGPNVRAAGGLETVRRCQSALAWTILGQMYPERRGQGPDTRARPACVALIGTGGASLTWDEASGRLLANVRIGGVALRASVEPLVGTTLIAPSALKKIGIAPASGAANAAAMLGGELVTGVPVMLPEVDVQGARARQVSAIATDADLADLDLVLGINFMWRFNRYDVESGTLLFEWGAPIPRQPEAADEDSQ